MVKVVVALVASARVTLPSSTTHLSKTLPASGASAVTVTTVFCSILSVMGVPAATEAVPLITVSVFASTGFSANSASIVTSFAGMMKVMVALVSLASVTPPALTTHLTKCFPSGACAVTVTSTPSMARVMGVPAATVAVPPVTVTA